MASAASASSLPREADDGAHHQQDHHELPHVMIFPFMAKSHTIPLTHLVHLLRRRQLATVTFFTTPGNAAFLRAKLPGADDGGGVAVVELPFTGHVNSTAPKLQAPRSASRPSTRCPRSPLSWRPRRRCDRASRRRSPPCGPRLPSLWPTRSYTGPTPQRRRSASAHWPANMFAHVIREACLRYNPAAELSRGAPDDAVFTVPEFPHVQLDADGTDPRVGRQDRKGHCR
ncbi:hypothetical protein PR202_ga00150 [Eleusine coracana subsp. coracana]|uniref:Uncharacterized protein n=1 Tax=Eleusine coracana subsp. coracana TaxID=191504 RepID=A0AAV5BED2_ELECO|nr:hypothetical protein PR202_ga00150 [Eleusine coracana subsp. coracana]